ncbi:MAG: rpsA [Planctomycetaceae bacterium]|nr:rpsA [Planctomycetaceae bacterium]
MELLSVGMIVDGVVTRLEPYGAWIEVEGRTGLVTIPEVSWSRIRHPGEALSVGQTLQVKILSTFEGRPFGASVRALHPELDPWYDPALFAVGTEFVGTVERKLEYGCIIGITPDVAGLLPRDAGGDSLDSGDQVRVRIEKVELAARKIELSLVTN